MGLTAPSDAAGPGTSFHMCLNLEGFISNSRFPDQYEHMFKHDDGRPMGAMEARDKLFEYVRKGWLVIPFGECDNFDYQTGCMGHPSKEST